MPSSLSFCPCARDAGGGCGGGGGGGAGGALGVYLIHHPLSISTSRSQERTPTHKPTHQAPALSFYPGRKELGCLGFVSTYLLPSTFFLIGSKKHKPGVSKLPVLCVGLRCPTIEKNILHFQGGSSKSLQLARSQSVAEVPKNGLATLPPPPLRLLSPLPCDFYPPSPWVGFGRLHLYSSEASVSCSSTSGGKGRKFSSSSRIPALLLLVFSWRRLVS